MRDVMTNLQYKDKNRKSKKLRKINAQKNSDIMVESSGGMKS